VFSISLMAIHIKSLKSNRNPFQQLPDGTTAFADGTGASASFNVPHGVDVENI